MILVLAIQLGGTTAQAGIASKAIQEAIEFTVRKFGKEAVKEGIENLAAKITRLAAKHGDNIVVSAFKKVGPRAHIVEAAGEHGGLALRLLSKHGDEALSLTLRKGSLQTISQFGDDAAEVLLKHGSIGQDLIERFGKQGVESLAKVTPQNGRRLAMMAGGGTLKPELLSVVRQYGDEACDFIWRNKGALSLGSGLAAFVASPKEFFDGTQKLAGVAADAVVKPIATIPATVATEAAKGVNWNLVVTICAFPLVALCCRWAGVAQWIRSILWSPTRKTEEKPVVVEE